MKRTVLLPLFSIMIFLTLIALGCSQNKEEVSQDVVEQPENIEEADPTIETDSEQPAVRIVVGERSPGFPGAKAHFSNLKDGDVLEDSKLSVVVDVENYELGIQTDTPRAQEIANSGKGQHAHIILDNDPYFANYESGKPFDIGILDEGPHTLLVFPSRSYHESVKDSGSVDIANFYIGKQEGEFMLDESKPTIIYSRPKGKYEGHGAEKIMLDFYLINAELGDDFKAKYTIRKNEANAEEYSITLYEWNPAFVTGLTSGEYIVTLQLLDKDGNLVDGPFNNTERKITVVTQ
ncbi:MAG: hypothetical protein DHS20C13_22600 [Thermodesulfobacteriota bacterium]|nr:MAG: hypothetical protein DHS20C13_22600 [Thermodesulfobacteriota bacterium]